MNWLAFTQSMVLLVQAADGLWRWRQRHSPKLWNQLLVLDHRDLIPLCAALRETNVCRHEVPALPARPLGGSQATCPTTSASDASVMTPTVQQIDASQAVSDPDRNSRQPATTSCRDLHGRDFFPPTINVYSRHCGSMRVAHRALAVITAQGDSNGLQATIRLLGACCGALQVSSLP